MASQATLSAASNDRKARLAQLKSLKSKQAPTGQDVDVHRDTEMSLTDEKANTAKSPPPQSQSRKRSRSPSPSAETKTYLSGRNYDPATRGPRLGFETLPQQGKENVETQAARLAEATRKQQEEEEKADKPLDLFKLQPKKPNWDLKRDLEKKLEVLNVRTDNAIARLVRERVLRQKEEEEKRQRGANGGAVEHESGDAVGMQGNDLVEAMHMREREEAEEEKRERAMDETDGV